MNLRLSLSVLLAACAMLLGACRSGPYHDTPRYKLPETRSTAARHVNEALTSSGRGLSEVAGDEVRLAWHEIRDLPRSNKILVKRELRFNEVEFVDRPRCPGEWWEVEVRASGGIVTFEFEDDKDAAKFHSAARRLRQTITSDEREAIAEKYLRYLEGTYTRAENRAPAPTAAGETLRALTGKDFGTDTKRWREYFDQTSPTK